MLNIDIEGITIIASQAVQLHRAGLEIARLMAEVERLKAELAAKPEPDLEAA